MTGIIFTHPPDYVAASYAARSLIAVGVRPVIAIDRDDPCLHVDGAKVIRTAAPRRGNLNGKPFVLEALTIMRDLAEGDRILKIDSDTLVFRLDWLLGREETGIGLYHAQHRSFYGFCYSLRTDRLGDMIEALGDLPEGVVQHEDIAIGNLAEKCGGVFRFPNLTPGNRLGAYKWDTQRPVEWWKERYDALCFQRSDGKGREDVIQKMKDFQ